MSSSREKQDRVVGRIGLIVGVLLSLAIALLPADWAGSLPVQAQRTAAIAALMAVWWMTEAVPLAVTALLPLILFPLSGVLDADEAAAPYANKFVFLFLGGFMIARCVERWDLHVRIALLTVKRAGTQPARLVGGFMVATAMLSMWISNTASTVMMLPIGVSLIALLKKQALESKDAGAGETQFQSKPTLDNAVQAERFAVCLMLGIAYSASIGGLGTLIGTPTNLLLAGFAGEVGLELSFARWMVAAVPLELTMLLATWWLLTRWIYPLRRDPVPGSDELIQRQLTDLGKVSRAELTVLCVFLAAALAWILRGTVTRWLAPTWPAVERLDDTIIALAGAFVLFLIPVDSKGTPALDWETASSIPWGVLLLFGGGFSLAEGMEQSQLADWIGGQVAQFGWLPVGVLVLLVVTLIVFLTELTSNTPTAAAFIPALYSAAVGLEVPALLLLVPTTIAASCAFMLPVATPPNAIVFGSGQISIRHMIKAGVWLNLVGIIIITLWMFLWAQPVLIG